MGLEICQMLRNDIIMVRRALPLPVDPLLAHYMTAIGTALHSAISSIVCCLIIIIWWL